MYYKGSGHFSPSPVIRALASGQRSLLSQQQIRWCLRKAILADTRGHYLERHYKNKYGISESPWLDLDSGDGFWHVSFKRISSEHYEVINFHELKTHIHFMASVTNWHMPLVFESWCGILMLAELMGTPPIDMWHDGNPDKAWNLDIVIGDTTKKLNAAIIDCIEAKEKPPKAVYCIALPAKRRNKVTWAGDVLAARYKPHARTLSRYQVKEFPSPPGSLQNTLACIFSQ